MQPQARLDYASCFVLLVRSVDSLLSVPAPLSDALSLHCVISMCQESSNPLKEDLGLTPASSQSWCESCPDQRIAALPVSLEMMFSHGGGTVACPAL